MDSHGNTRFYHWSNWGTNFKFICVKIGTEEQSDKGTKKYIQQ
jgi:hypothetical protein